MISVARTTKFNLRFISSATFLLFLLSMDKFKPMKFILSILLVCIMILSCKKKSTIVSYQNEGVITGFNLLECPCVDTCPCACNAYFFHFTDHIDTSNIIIDNPSILKLPSQVTFPVHIKLNWINATRCNTFAIKITSYQIQ